MQEALGDDFRLLLMAHIGQQRLADMQAVVNVLVEQNPLGMWQTLLNLADAAKIFTPGTPKPT